MKRVAITMLAGVIVGASFACRQVAAIDDEPRPPDDAPVCSVAAAGSGPCRDCVLEACCEEGAACDAAPGCSDLESCARACAPDDAACAADCRARRPEAWAAPAIALASCRASHCSAQCSVRCGGWVHPDRECATCGASRCCDASAACMNDVRCASLVACELACKDDASCLLACELAAPESVAAARAFGACIAKECASSCVTRRWACLRSPPEEAPATGEPIEITYRFVDYAGEKPLRDLSVRACRANDLYCTAPLTSIAKTDGDGTVRIALEERAFDGYVEVTGALYGPVMLFFPRLTKSFVTGTHPLLSGSELADARNAITSAANSSFDPARGTVLAAVRDCNGDRAAGVSFTVAPLEGAVRFFSVGTGASPSPIATSNDGYSAGGFVNVVANAALTIGGRVEENGLTYPPSVVSVRPKTDGYTMTYLLAAPPR